MNPMLKTWEELSKDSVKEKMQRFIGTESARVLTSFWEPHELVKVELAMRKVKPTKKTADILEEIFATNYFHEGTHVKNIVRGRWKKDLEKTKALLEKNGPPGHRAKGEAVPLTLFRYSLKYRLTPHAKIENDENLVIQNLWELFRGKACNTYVSSILHRGVAYSTKGRSGAQSVSGGTSIATSDLNNAQAAHLLPEGMQTSPTHENIPGHALTPSSQSSSPPGNRGIKRRLDSMDSASSESLAISSIVLPIRRPKVEADSSRTSGAAPSPQVSSMPLSATSPQMTPQSRSRQPPREVCMSTKKTEKSKSRIKREPESSTSRSMAREERNGTEACGRISTFSRVASAANVVGTSSKAKRKARKLDERCSSAHSSAPRAGDPDVIDLT